MRPSVLWTSSPSQQGETLHTRPLTIPPHRFLLLSKLSKLVTYSVIVVEVAAAVVAVGT